jgi:hypothetical protein
VTSEQAPLRSNTSCAASLTQRETTMKQKIYSVVERKTGAWVCVTGLNASRTLADAQRRALAIRVHPHSTLEIQLNGVTLCKNSPDFRDAGKPWVVI